MNIKHNIKYDNRVLADILLFYFLFSFVISINISACGPVYCGGPCATSSEMSGCTVDGPPACHCAGQKITVINYSCCATCPSYNSCGEDDSSNLTLMLTYQVEDCSGNCVTTGGGCQPSGSGCTVSFDPYYSNYDYYHEKCVCTPWPG